MNKRNIITITTLALVATLAAGAVMAHPEGRRGPRPGMAAGHGQHGGMGPLGRLGMLREELNLSDEQVDRIKAIFKETREQNEAVREQLGESRGDAIETLIANPNDVAGAQAVIDRQMNAQRALRTNHVAAMSKALKVLTAEQRAKLADIIEKRQDRRAHRLERRRNR
jgi:protein CpxP